MKKSVFFILTLILLISILNFTVTMPIAQADTDSWQVTLYNQQANFRAESSEWWGMTGWHFAGDYASDNYDTEFGVHFDSIGIPQGAIIVSAYLNFTVNSIQGNDPTLYITGEDMDDASLFSTSANYKSRVRTDAVVTWNPTGWTDNDMVLTEDLKTIVQEIVDRVGWVSGQDMVFFINHSVGWIGATERVVIYSEDITASKAPRLEIEWSEVSLPSITFYNQSNSVFMMNGTKIANGTVVEYINETKLELQGIINVSTQFVEWNITTGNIQVNPYNYTVTQDATIWLLVDAVSGGNGDGETLFLFGSVNAIPMNLLYYIALTTIGLILLLKSQFIGKLLSSLLFAFQAIWISGDILLDTQINYISAYNPTSGVYQYVNTVTHINTPILSFLIILSIGLALKGAIDTFSIYNKRKG